MTTTHFEVTVVTSPAHSPQDRAFYPHWHTIPIRHADLDELDHVNNVVFAVYCEEARRHLYSPMSAIQHSHGAMIFVVRLSIDFHREMTFPGTVEVGTAITKLGNSSFTMTQGLFTEHGFHATAEVVTVVVNRDTRRSMPIPQPLRDYFAGCSRG